MRGAGATWCLTRRAMSDVHEVIIIGGGPAAYTAALYAARGNLKPVVFEGFQYGGQLMITSDVENYPGFEEGILGPQLMTTMRAQAERFGAQMVSENVTRVDFSSRPLRVYVGEEEHRAQTVIVANAGVKDVLGSEQGSVTAVRLTDTVTGEQRELRADGLFVAIGHDPTTELFRGTLKMDGAGYLITRDGSTATNVEGVFAAGD